jgi:peptidyl-tRNA hydrolase, PTH1 family
MVVDEIARRMGVQSWKKKDSAHQYYDAARRIVLVKPLSFMNLSGTPVRLISSWYRTPPEGVMVVVDEMDLPFGALRMRPFGGHGGHNGLRSVIATIGDRFPRIRVGVGRPRDDDAVDHVLSTFSSQQREALPRVIEAAADGVQLWLDEGIERAMQWVNTWQLNAERE